MTTEYDIINYIRACYHEIIYDGHIISNTTSKFSIIFYHILHTISICYLTCYIIYELMVYGTDRNSSLDEGGVFIQHDGDRHLARTHSRLGNLKGDRSVTHPS